MERLHQELLAIPGLEQLSALQVQDLAWKTREQVLIALFHEHSSSVAVAEELRTLARDRRLERKTEKAEDLDREQVRKNDERYKSAFMTIAATELARLGAPSLISWQKLVFDRDCCAQAIRILLTKLKSARRRSSSSVSVNALRRSVAIASRESDHQEDERRSVASASSPHPPDDHVLPQLPQRVRAVAKNKPKTSTRPSEYPEWNTDTSVNDMSSPSSNQVSTPSGRQDRELGSPFESDISMRRTTPTKKSTVVNKAKLGLMQTLQQENEALQEENVKLRSEVEHLEALVSTLQSDWSARGREGPPLLHVARIRLLQAQNMQLHRQITLLHDAVQDREVAESMLVSSLTHWRSVVELGMKDAIDAGADNGVSNANKPAKWMFAVPSKLLEELTRVEQQVYQAKRTMARAVEARLRIGGAVADFVRDSSSTINIGHLCHSGLPHIRVERIRRLETSLAMCAKSLLALHEQVVKDPPLMRFSPSGANNSPSDTATALAQATSTLHDLIIEVGAFGVVVPACKEVIRGHTQDIGWITVAQVTREVANTSSLTPKEREKQIKTFLKQLQAKESSMERERELLLREIRYWKSAWRMQQDLATTLIHRVKGIGDKKIQWCEANLVGPLRELDEVFNAFQKAAMNETRIHKNAFLPLLLETLERHQPLIFSQTMEMWQHYMMQCRKDIDEIIEDYEANGITLKASALKD